MKALQLVNQFCYNVYQTTINTTKTVHKKIMAFICTNNAPKSYLLGSNLDSIAKY